jgi:hypothetical protein
MNILFLRKIVLKQPAVWGSLLSLGVLLGAMPGARLFKTEAIATLPPPEHTVPQTHQPTVHGSIDHQREYRRIDQPLSHNVIVSVGGLALMLAELWWFLLSAPKARPPVTSDPPPDKATVDKAAAGKEHS